MSQDFETAVDNIVTTLINLGVDEPEFRDKVNGLGLTQYDDLHTANQNSRQQRMKEALREMRRQRFLDQFEDPLKELRPMDNNFLGAVDALFEATLKRRAGWYTTPEPPWNSHVVKEGGMVDREKLRSGIEDMLREMAPRRVLYITGDGELGKSFSCQLLRVVAARRGIEIAEVDLKYWDTGTDGASAEDVAKSFADQLGLEPPTPQPNTTPTKKGKDLAIGLANAIRSKKPNETPWLFIDHVDTCSAKTEEIKPFIQGLARLAAVETRNFRLVVVARKMDEQTALGQEAARRAVKEQVKAIASSDIEKYFLDFAKHVNKNNFSANDARAACQEAWNRAGGQGNIFDLPYCLWQIAEEKLS